MYWVRCCDVAGLWRLWLLLWRLPACLPLHPLAASHWAPLTALMLSSETLSLATLPPAHAWRGAPDVLIRGCGGGLMRPLAWSCWRTCRCSSGLLLPTFALSDLAVAPLQQGRLDEQL